MEKIVNDIITIMQKTHIDSKKKVIHYYTKRESRWGYSILLRGIRHFGYYPEGKENISMRDSQVLMIDKLAEKLNLRKDSLLLDAGCGEGFVAIYLATKYGYRAQGVDLLDLSIQKAKRLLNNDLDKLVTFQVMDYTQLDFPDETFDAVYTMETLVHAPNYLQALQEFHRVLKPHGKLVLFEYSLKTYNEPLSKEEKTWKLILEESGMHSLPHFLHGKFPQILKKAGFTAISVENISPRVLPMLKKFALMSYIPFLIVALFGLQRKFVNIVSGRIGLSSARNDFWRYNIVTAKKV